MCQVQRLQGLSSDLHWCQHNISNDPLKLFKFGVIPDQEPSADLVKVAVQEAASQVRGSLHQLEETHKVVAVDCSEGLDGQLDLGRVSHLLTELLHLPAQRSGLEGLSDQQDTVTGAEISGCC